MSSTTPPQTSVPVQLDQYMTPVWAVELLFDQTFPDLTGRDRVLEPSCGRGAWLHACVQRGIPVLGIEIDPTLAAEAHAQTGAQVLTGDLRTIRLPEFQPTVLVGNPPFDLALIDQFLARAATLLPRDGRIAWVLPAYAVQTYGRVLRWNSQWSLAADFLPRALFPGLRLPVIFAHFRKEATPRLIGFSLYQEIAGLENLSDDSQAALRTGRPHRGAWRALVEDALIRLGGCATVASIYAAVDAGRLPTPFGMHWRAKIRQTLQRHFHHVDHGVWSLPEAIAA